jgi:hypothetical protein
MSRKGQPVRNEKVDLFKPNSVATNLKRIKIIDYFLDKSLLLSKIALTLNQ